MGNLGKSQQKLLGLVNNVFSDRSKTADDILDAINGKLETTFTSRSGIENAIKEFDPSHQSAEIGRMKNAFSALAPKKRKKYARFSKAAENAAKIGLDFEG